MQLSKKNFEISYKFPFVPKTATSLLYSVSCRKEPYFLQVGHPFRAKRKLTLLPVLYFRSCLVIQKAYKYSLFSAKKVQKSVFSCDFSERNFCRYITFLESRRRGRRARHPPRIDPCFLCFIFQKQQTPLALLSESKARQGVFVCHIITVRSKNRAYGMGGTSFLASAMMSMNFLT